MHTILVTGATGNIGREVVAQLRQRKDCRIRALTRRPETADLGPAVDVFGGDLTVPESLDASAAGADAVFLVWTAPLDAAAPAIARIAPRVGRIVLLTSPHRTPHPFFQQPNTLRVVYEGLEQTIEASGVPWTFLRPGVFALNCLAWWGPQVRNGDVVRWFYPDAATAPIHEHDVAAVAVRALCEDGHSGREYVLTGPESLTQREQVEILGDAIGRPLRYDGQTHDEARAELLAVAPAFVVDMLLTAYAAAVGLPALVTSNVLDVTGTPARSFHQWAVDHAGQFRADRPNRLQ
ncbi:MAG TPA: NAD(P)H-binding protein [Vicinamibacterales bacterium]|nr:NAD(P)H-binding protein [Vicinamibacterales bacterium]